MTNDDLFPEDDKVPEHHYRPKGFLQKAVVNHLRAGGSFTEESYQNTYGGRSISAVIFNIQKRGLLAPDEHVMTKKAIDSRGNETTMYTLVKISPINPAPVEGLQELDTTESDKGAYGPLESGEDEDERVEGVSMDEAESVEWETVSPQEFVDRMAEEPVAESAPPEVSSIMVGVNRHDPELVIMFKGDEYKPLRHVLTPMEVKYLLTNLEAFRPKRES